MQLRVLGCECDCKYCLFERRERRVFLTGKEGEAGMRGLLIPRLSLEYIRPGLRLMLALVIFAGYIGAWFAVIV